MDLERITISCQNLSCNSVPWGYDGYKPIQLPPNFVVCDSRKCGQGICDVVYIADAEERIEWPKVIRSLPEYGKIYAVLHNHSQRERFINSFLGQKCALVDERVIDGKIHFILRVPRRWKKKSWSGEKQCRVLVHSGGGFGDDFHGGRYAFNLKEQGVHSIFEARGESYTFFKECSHFDEVILKGQNVEHDFQVKIGDLAEKYGFRPLVFPYFKRPEPLSLEGKIKVGFTNRGNFVKYGVKRHFDLKDFKMFHDMELYYLHKERDYENQTSQTETFYHRLPIEDWLDAAKIICSMDWVISPDTALSHISSGLGTRTLMFATKDHANIYHPYPQRRCKSYPEMEIFWGGNAIKEIRDFIKTTCSSIKFL